MISKSAKSSVLPILTSLVIVLVILLGNLQASQFIALGYLPGGEISSRAIGVDSSGQFVVGSSSDGGVFGAAFLWDETSGMQPIPLATDARAVSNNGEVVVGYTIIPPSGVTEPYRWTAAGGLELLGLPPGEVAGTPTFAVDVSHDGSVIVGTTIFGGEYEAYLWTASEGFIGLSDLFSGDGTSAAAAVSEDGKVIVGQTSGSGVSKAFRWTSFDGMINLGDLPGGDTSAGATNVSADGSVVVGMSDSATGIEAFYWTEDDGIEGLGFLPGLEFQSVATAATGSGEAIIGFSGVLQNMEAFVWSEGKGIQSLQSILETRFGLDEVLSGWHLTIPHDISSDGRSIVGRGHNPNGDLEAWLVRLDQPIFVPEPSSLALLLLAAALVAPRNRRR